MDDKTTALCKHEMIEGLLLKPHLTQAEFKDLDDLGATPVMMHKICAKIENLNQKLIDSLDKLSEALDFNTVFGLFATRVLEQVGAYYENGIVDTPASPNALCHSLSDREAVIDSIIKHRNWILIETYLDYAENPQDFDPIAHMDSSMQERAVYRMIIKYVGGDPKIKFAIKPDYSRIEALNDYQSDELTNLLHKAELDY